MKLLTLGVNILPRSEASSEIEGAVPPNMRDYVVVPNSARVHTYLKDAGALPPLILKLGAQISWHPALEKQPPQGEAQGTGPEA